MNQMHHHLPIAYVYFNSFYSSLTRLSVTQFRRKSQSLNRGGTSLLTQSILIHRLVYPYFDSYSEFLSNSLSVS